MAQYVVTRTTTETIGIEVDSMTEASKAVQNGQGDVISIMTNIAVRPRPTAPSSAAAAKAAIGAATAAKGLPIPTTG